MTLTVTPADYTTVTWFIDGEEIQTGKEIDLALKAGTYHLKVTATTSIGKSTYREGLIQVNPLADDPWATEIDFERIITTGAKAQLYGNNLDKVNSIVIGGKTATDIAYTENGENSYIEYTVPEGLADGTYRIILVDNGGNEYGGNKVTVTSDALITAGSERYYSKQRMDNDRYQSQSDRIVHFQRTDCFQLYPSVGNRDSLYLSFTGRW